MDTAENAEGFFPTAGELIAGKYEIERIIGQGGMGAVFSALNRLTGRRVALKWVLPDKANSDSRARLLREARATCSVHHPNVVDVYDVSEHEGGLFIVMEYLDGRSLSSLLEERGYLDPTELIGLLMPALRGVQAAHDAGVIHRDLKPDNILLCQIPGGDVLPKVLDFGISKTLGGGDALHASLTHTGAMIGTPHFMALEQVDGSGDIDARTDVYAFGVMLYLGLTGQFPFDGESLGELILKIGTRAAPPPSSIRPELSPQLEAVVLKAMARRREDRFSSVAEFAVALEPFTDGVPFRRTTSDETARRIPMASAEGRLPAGSVRESNPTRRRRVAVPFALGSLLLVAAAGSYLWLGAGDEAPSASAARKAAAGPAAAIEPASVAPQLPNAAAPQLGVLGPLSGHETTLPLGADLPGTQTAEEEESELPVRAGSEADKEAEAPPSNATSAAKSEATRATRQRRRKAANARRRDARHRNLDRAAANADNHISGQRTPGFSADDF